MLQVSLKDTETVVSAGEVQYAREHPMEEARIRQQMEKLGNTEFVWDSLDIQSDGNIFVPVKVLNELRRTALAQLEQEFLEKIQKRSSGKDSPGGRSEDTARSQIRGSTGYLCLLRETGTGRGPYEQSGDHRPLSAF